MDPNHILCLMAKIVLMSLTIARLFDRNKKVLQGLFEIYCGSKEIGPTFESLENIFSRNCFLHRMKVNKSKSDWHRQ